MYDINFLTPEYQEKLRRNNLIRRCSFVLGVLLAIELIVFSGLSLWNNSIEDNLAFERQEIAAKEQEIDELKKKMSEIPDLTDKIAVIEDLFKNENFRISEVIKSLDENAPTNIWFNKMNYNSGAINLSGMSYQNWELGLTSEENLYQFEKNLIDSGFYSRVHHEFTRAGEQNGHKISNFQFKLEMRDQ